MTSAKEKTMYLACNLSHAYFTDNMSVMSLHSLLTISMLRFATPFIARLSMLQWAPIVLHLLPIYFYTVMIVISCWAYLQNRNVTLSMLSIELPVTWMIFKHRQLMLNLLLLFSDTSLVFSALHSVGPGCWPLFHLFRVIRRLDIHWTIWRLILETWAGVEKLNLLLSLVEPTLERYMWCDDSNVV